MVFAYTIDRPMIYEQFQEHLKIQLANCLFIMLNVLTVSDFILHIFDFLLSWIKSHASHHVCYCTQGHFAIKLSGLCSVLIFGSNLTVVKEILQVAHDLAICSSFE